MINPIVYLIAGGFALLVAGLLEVRAHRGVGTASIGVMTLLVAAVLI